MKMSQKTKKQSSKINKAKQSATKPIQQSSNP